MSQNPHADLTQNNLILVNGRVITPEGVMDGGGVAVRGATISHVFRMDEVQIPYGSGGARIIDVGGDYISPGFIDIHVHGGGGADFMDGTPQALATIARIHASGGSTSILPTTLTSSVEDLFRALDAVKAYTRSVDRLVQMPFSGPVDGSINEPRSKPGEKPAQPSPGFGASVLGVHLEGPYLSPAQKGAHDPRYLKEPDRKEYLEILDYSGHIMRVSAAPELPGALDLGRELSARGILAAIAHSDATYDQVIAAAHAGYRLVTHLYSACSIVRRVRGYRIPGVVETALLLDELAVEILADGHHLPEGLLRLVFKVKGPDRIVLVTDAMRAAGLGDGEYELGPAGCGWKTIVEGGVAKLPDRTSFAGSVALANTLVQNMVNVAGVSLVDSVKMITATPAKILGIQDRKGAIAPGMDADIVVFDPEVTVKFTIVEGKMAYECHPGRA